jgi:hypothetical protein
MPHVPDFTTKDGGLCRCTALRITRKEGAPEYLVDLSLTFPLELDGNDTADNITLPPLLQHAAEVLESALDGGGGTAKVQHAPEIEGRASLHVLVGEKREQLCMGARATARKVVLYAEQKRPRAVWTLRIAMPLATAGQLVGALEEDVDVRFDPVQGGLPLVPAMPPGKSGGAEA